MDLPVICFTGSLRGFVMVFGAALVCGGLIDTNYYITTTPSNQDDLFLTFSKRSKALLAQRKIAR